MNDKKCAPNSNDTYAPVSVDAECVCGHRQNDHLTHREVNCGACDCGDFQPAEETESEPATESVYEKARSRMAVWRSEPTVPPTWQINTISCVLDALDAGEAAEKRAEGAERERDEARRGHAAGSSRTMTPAAVRATKTIRAVSVVSGSGPKPKGKQNEEHHN